MGAGQVPLEGQVGPGRPEPARAGAAAPAQAIAAELALLGALALPIVVALIAHGGFFPRGQTAFALAAGATFVIAVALAGWSAAALRAPAVLALVGLAALSALSAAWTVASADDALRWGAVIGGLALLAVAASITAERLGAVPIAATIAVLAAVAGIIGLYGAGARVPPLAERLGGQWSPGGPLEYSPALALLQVSALPVLWAGMARCGQRLAAAAAAGAGVAGGVLALAGSRVELAIAAGVAIACVLAAGAVGARRTTVLAAAALVATAGGAADAIAGSYVPPGVTDGDAPRLIGLAAVVFGAAGLWVVQRRALGAPARSWAARWLAVAAVMVPLAGASVAAAVTPDSGPQAEPVSGFAHGRTQLWRAAVDTAEDRPLAGSGSLSFYSASLRHQDPPPVRFAHNLPLETWAELGLAGAALALVLYAGSAGLIWSRRRSAAAWLLGPAIAGFLVANLFDWPWHVPASGAVFAISLGALLAASSRLPPSTLRDS